MVRWSAVPPSSVAPVNAAWSFGMVRSHAVGALRTRFRELCDVVSKVTGVVFTPLHAETYRELAEEIGAGTVGVAWMPPLLAIELEDLGLATPLALPVRRDGTSYYAAFVSRDPRDKTINDLRGKRVAWVDKESAAGYLVPRMHLASLGMDPRTFFSRQTFAGSHIAAIDAVVSGAADVAATFCTIDPASKRTVTAGWLAADGAKVRDVEVVATVGPIPNDAIVASTRVQAPVRTSLTRWLLSPDARSQDLLGELFQVRSFRTASSAHFDTLRHMVRAARSRGHDG
jgi:phosphonate transport system substrate-binding protein